MQVALCQTDIDWLDTAANLRKIESIVRGSSAEMIIFPEMALSGFSMDPEPAAIRAEEIEKLFSFTAGLKPWIVVGAAVKRDQSFTNDCLLIQDGKLQGAYSKTNLFSYAGEDKSYCRGVGPKVFQVGQTPFCPLVCYDLRFPEMFTSVAENVKIFTVIANWPASRSEHWKLLLRARALDAQAYVIGVNRTGSGNQIHYQGDSAVIGPDGKIECDYLPKGEAIVTIDLDLERVAEFRRSFPVLQDRKRNRTSLVS